MTHLIESPPHYTKGRYEAIEVIEDAISRAPDPVLGNCQGQALRYLLRLWDKDAPSLNAGKAKWYINRLLDHLNS